LRQAAALIAEGVSPFEAARTLRAARAAPPGRRQVVAVADAPSGGDVALSWDDGAEYTGLDGQRFLPLDLEDEGEDPFDAAMEAEADGDLEAAARLYAASAQADPRDPIAPFNLGNLQMAEGDADAATLSYHQAIARDPGFAEAYYNLAAAYERSGAAGKAEATLEAALQRDPAYGDALFNLGQLKLAKGANAEASALFEAYLAQNPPDEWAGKARKALRVARADPRPR
ncbi:MAG: tetratricopeptide repeat protein, partial [Pseudomonadota bacterium]